MASHEVVKGHIKRFVLQQFPQSRVRHLSDEDDLLEKGIVDSLGVIEIVEYLEREFQLTCSDDDLVPENFRSIDRLSRFVMERCDGPATEATGD